MRTLFIIIAAVAVLVALSGDGLTDSLSARLLADNDIVAPDIQWDDDDDADGDGDDNTGTLTDVTTVTKSDSTKEDATIYDLQGRRVTTPQPGVIYICRGKKVVWAQ